ncbi:unnamed protein product [marine sediment metagenome]|uniref:Uncharacterized protein n=1 Tax=marine sediment metagenome TaxID=412755 RepID=X0YPC2_9ZZZZ
MEKKVYFDDDGIALGTSEDYYGEYFAAEMMMLPNEVDPENKTYEELLALSNNYRKAIRRFDHLNR